MEARTQRFFNVDPDFDTSVVHSLEALLATSGSAAFSFPSAVPLRSFLATSI